MTPVKYDCTDPDSIGNAIGLIDAVILITASSEYLEKLSKRLVNDIKNE